MVHTRAQIGSVRARAGRKSLERGISSLTGASADQLASTLLDAARDKADCVRD